MPISHFILFMCFLTVCTGIKCVGRTQLQFPTSKMVLAGLESTFDNLETNSSLECQAQIEFDSIAQKFTVKFGQSLDSPRLRSVENTYIYIATSIISARSDIDVNQTSIRTIGNFVCSSNDECDRQLVLEHINWLITTNYKNLESTVRPLILVQGDKKNECTIGNGSTVEPCHDLACSWYHSIDTEEDEGKCESAYPRTLPTLELTTEISMFEKLKKHDEKETKPIRGIFKHNSSMKFWCELNNCNNQNVSELIKEAVSKETNLWAMDHTHRTHRK